MRRVSRGFSGWRAGKQLIKTVITTEQCRSSFCVIDNNKELVMPNTVAQCVSSMFCFWMKNNQRYSDKKERMTETLAKLDLCSLSTKCFFFFFAVMEQLLQLVGVLSYAIPSSTGELHRREETQDHRQVKLSITSFFIYCHCSSSLIAKHMSQ